MLKGVSHNMVSRRGRPPTSGLLHSKFHHRSGRSSIGSGWKYQRSEERESFYLEPELRIGRFSKALFLPLLREFIACRESFPEVTRSRQHPIASRIPAPLPAGVSRLAVSENLLLAGTVFADARPCGSISSCPLLAKEVEKQAHSILFSLEVMCHPLPALADTSP